MIDVAATIGIGMITLALVLNLWRLLKGPSAADRVVALDTMYINTLAVLVLFGVWKKSALYFEAGLIIAMLGFVGTIALAKFLLRDRVIE
ncbi:MAG TPA: K+/H+ antiporter subunit F [Longimicrobiales bacterium]|nr:K+/H+ antiporter subunit F [Longimicrobiales bacterium]